MQFSAASPPTSMFLVEYVKLYCCCFWSRTSQGSLWSSIVSSTWPGRAAIQLQAAYLPWRGATQIGAGSSVVLWALPQTWALSSSTLHPPPHCRGNTSQGVRTWQTDRDGQIGEYTYDFKIVVSIHVRRILILIFWFFPSHFDFASVVHQSNMKLKPLEQELRQVQLLITIPRHHIAKYLSNCPQHVV